MHSQIHHFSLSNQTENTDIQYSDLIAIDLPENSTSGYRWQLVPHLNIPGLKLIDQKFKGEEQKTIGTRHFLFQALNKNIQISLKFQLKSLCGPSHLSFQEFNLKLSIH